MGGGALDGDRVWRWMRWVIGAAVLVVVATLLLQSPVRSVDIPLDTLPVRTLDGVTVDKAWFGGQPGVIHAWLPG